MAGTVTLWEYADLKRDSRGQASVLAGGVLATDLVAAETGSAVPIKTVATSGTAANCDPLTNKTNFVIMKATALTYYRIKPKGYLGSLTWAATSSYRSIPAGGEVVEAVYPGAVISFKE